MTARRAAEEVLGIPRPAPDVTAEDGGRLLLALSALCGASARSEFLLRVRELVRILAGPVPCSFIAGDRASELRLLGSSLAPTDRMSLAPPLISHPVLAECLARGEAYVHAAGPSATISIDGRPLPIVRIDPVSAAGRVVGLLVFHEEPAEGRWSEAARRIACPAIGIALRRLLEREEMEEELDSYRTRLEAINAIGHLLGHLDLEVLLSKLMELAIYIPSAQVGSIVFAEGDAYATRAEWGLSLDILQGLELDGRPLLEQVVREGRSVWVGREEAERIRSRERRVHIDSLISIPLATERRTLGAVTLINSSEGDRGLSRLDMESVRTISGLAAAAMENAILHAEAVEKERLAASLRIAQRIQEGLYPRRAPEDLDLQFGWINRSCEETGGDYFDFLSPAGGGFAVAVGDVAGHGLGAALLMASARAALRACATLSGDIGEIVRHLNDLLEEDMEVDRFMTLFLATIDPASGRLRYINAGHDAPCLFRAGRGTIEALGPTGMPLGIERDAIFRVVEVEPIGEGDILLIATDGIWEARDPTGAMFGKERLYGVLAGAGRSSAQAIADAIFAELESFRGPAPIADDFTLLVVKRIGGTCREASGGPPADPSKGGGEP